VALARGAVTVREVDEPLVQLGGRLLAQRRLAGAPETESATRSNGRV